jgi:hypothetical protein
VFPWEPDAGEGEPFTPGYVNPEQTDGRYDLQGKPVVLNLAESPAHAIAEQIQTRHGRRLRKVDLTEAGRPLALVEVKVGGRWASVPDLSVPGSLKRFGCRPDHLMSRDYQCSQRLSRRLYGKGLPGFRVWSALSGDWHTTVLFMDREAGDRLGFGRPRWITPRSRGLVEAAGVLDIALG